MVEKRWLTKEEKRLLKPHAEHYYAMFAEVQSASDAELEKLRGACRSCTTSNCAWSEYRAAQYLLEEIDGEIAWRARRDAEAAERLEPTERVHARWADDGGRQLEAA